MMLPEVNTCNVSVLGLGYVGLPLIVQIAKTNRHLITDQILDREIIGFDIDEKRICQLKEGFDRTKEVSNQNLLSCKKILFTSDKEKLYESDIFIVTVPTPIDKVNNPDFKALQDVCRIIGEIFRRKTLNNAQLVIFESTVFPGATEEVCVPIIENYSGLTFNKDFFCGYSPERINPSDKNYTIDKIVKVTSGSNTESAIWVDKFYKSFINAGTFPAASIKVAEAAKVIENTQRDLNIALINELAIIFKKINIDTKDVLDAAGTKWNFLPFTPGLVGGHCIGVDPYYLTYKAQQIGHYPKVVLAGREINDGMSNWIAEELIKLMLKNKLSIHDANVLMLGISFKENCPDTRNSKVLELISKLQDYGMNIDIHDPVIDPLEVKNKYNLTVLEKIKENKKYNVVILAVGHSTFCNLNEEYWENLISHDGIFVDLKGVIPRKLNCFRL